MADAELAKTALSRAQVEYLRDLPPEKRPGATDPRTRVWQKSGIDAIIKRELSRGQPSSLALIELAGLPVDDIPGQLALAADRVRRVVRPCDALGHGDQDRFWLVLENCDCEQAHGVAERVRAHLAHAPLDGGAARVSPSIGVATWDLKEDDAALRARATVNLERAREAGGNRVSGTET
jgi:hypothetical protein